MTELHLGITLAEIALTARYPEKIVRNMARARRVYNNACKYKDRTSLDGETSKTFDNLLETLHAHLVRLEDKMNVCELSAILLPESVPTSSTNGPTDSL